MSLKRFFLKNRIFLITLLLFIFFTYLIILFFYKGINRVYFQQDEWHAIGKSIYYLYANPLDLLMKKRGNHYIPLTSIFYILEYLLFGLKANLYLYLGIFFQGIAVFTFYLLSKRLFKMKPLALLISFLFLISPGSYQVILNSSTTYYILEQIAMNVFFIILYDHITKDSRLSRKKILILGSIFLISTLIYESAFVLILTCSLFSYFFRSKKFKLNLSKSNMFSAGGVLFFAFFLVAFEMKFVSPDLPSIKIENFKLSTVYNIAATPFKLIANNLFGQENIFSVARIYSRNLSPFRSDPAMNLELLTETTAYDVMVFYSLMLVFTFFTFLMYLNKSIKARELAFKISSFSFLSIVCYGIILSPQGRIFNSPDSRYLYLSAESTLFILGSMIYLVWERFKNVDLFKLIGGIILLAYIIVWGIYSFNYTQSITRKVEALSMVRKNMIDQVYYLHPTVPAKAAIYIHCKNNICGGNSKFEMLPSWVVPFQSGFGWSLLTVYSGVSPKKYAPFFSEYFLWDPLSNNYKEINGIGFGYFTSINALKKTVKKYHLSGENVIILEYDSYGNKIKNITNKNGILSTYK